MDKVLNLLLNLTATPCDPFPSAYRDAYRIHTGLGGLHLLLNHVGVRVGVYDIVCFSMRWGVYLFSWVS